MSEVENDNEEMLNHGIRNIDCVFKVDCYDEEINVRAVYGVLLSRSL